MNPKYDMKEYNKFPKIKPTQWKNVLFLIKKIVVKNKRSLVDRFGYKDIVIFSI